MYLKHNTKVSYQPLSNVVIDNATAALFVEMYEEFEDTKGVIRIRKSKIPQG